MIAILVVLFIFGLLIYDFSDELGKEIANYDWYKVQESGMTVLSFRDHKFSYIYEETGRSFGPYANCRTFKYNHSIQVLRLDCSVRGNKLFITPVEDDRLVITVDNVEKTFFKNREDAINARFMEDNDLTQLELEDLLDYNLADFNRVSINEVSDLQRGRSSEYVAIIKDFENLRTALNVKTLSLLENEVERNLSLIIVNDKPANDIDRLNDLFLAFDDCLTMVEVIPIYLVGERTVTLAGVIDTERYNEINNFEKIWERN
jgi:transcriptional regulator with XRE-family HTH domain